ncbi:MAG TPA: family 1 glycosylhydrolase [Microthrixaceae bacterium]|nr:family 1 glycosylhydrolase [Microthrixaceae bacterium]
MSNMDFPAFAIACGEEGSDPLVLHEGRVVRVDQYRASGHLERLDADLADVAGLGVKVWRYGVPWRLTEPEPGVYDWTLWDRALEACRRHGLDPVIDLCHFGLPDHHGGFCDTTWVDDFARYVDAFLARYPEPRWFTPVNEPGITAMFSALLGMWNDRLASEDDYFVALGNVVLANLEALARIRADRDGWWIGSEGFGCDLADADDEAGIRAATRARDLQQAVWDLHLGLAPRGGAARLTDVVADSIQSRIEALVGVVPPDRIIAGHDIYPVSVTAHGTRAGRPLSIADRVRAYEDEATAWHERYQVPFWVSETSNLGLAVDQGSEWLAALTASLDTLSASGLPVRGICWYSRGDQYDWDTALMSPIGTVTEVGLFDAQRHPRPVAQHYATLARRHP